jgi:rRNA maturation protein Nop10
VALFLKNKKCHDIATRTLSAFEKFGSCGLKTIKPANSKFAGFTRFLRYFMKE